MQSVRYATREYDHPAKEAKRKQGEKKEESGAKSTDKQELRRRDDRKRKMNTKVLVGALCATVCSMATAATLYPHVPLVMWSQRS